MINKESEGFQNMKTLTIEKYRMWNIEVLIMRQLKPSQNHSDSSSVTYMDSLQTTAILGTTHILRKVLV